MLGSSLDIAYLTLSLVNECNSDGNDLGSQQTLEILGMLTLDESKSFDAVLGHISGVGVAASTCPGGPRDINFVLC